MQRAQANIPLAHSAARTNPALRFGSEPLRKFSLAQPSSRSVSPLPGDPPDCLLLEELRRRLYREALDTGTLPPAACGRSGSRRPGDAQNGRARRHDALRCPSYADLNAGP